VGIPPFPPAVSRNLTGSCEATGEKAKYILSHRQKSHIKEVLKTPPLCFVMQNIGEVAHSDGGVENRPSSADLYWTFNPLARWALPLYRCAAQGERFESVTSNI